MDIWPNFFKTFIRLIQDEPDNIKKLIIIDYYLRILISIHTDIGDQLFQHDSKTVQVSNNLKDLIRLNDMENIVLNWRDILNFVGKSLESNSNQNLKVEILKNLFKVIGGWVSWIDINLVINNDFLDSFFNLFDIKLLRNDICTLFIEIFSKKMPSEKKMELLNLMKTNELIQTSMDTKLQFNDNDTDSNDPDEVSFYEHLASMINNVGIEYLIVIEKTDSSLELKQLAFQHLNSLLPYVLRILPNDFDDISFQVFPFISNFLTILKKISKHQDSTIINISEYSEFLDNLLDKIISKMKYDDDDDGLSDEDEDEDAQEFQDLRNKLKIFQDAISAINPDLFVAKISDVILKTLVNNGSGDWRNLELGLYELTNFSDIIRNNSMRLPKTEINKSKAFKMFESLLVDLINNKNNLLNKADHPLIQLCFLDLIIKHYTFFTSSSNGKNLNENNQLTNNILEIINSKYGLFNEHSKVQKRCFYLFSKFIKLTKPRLDPVILKNLIISWSESLLIIKAQVLADNKNVLSTGVLADVEEEDLDKQDVSEDSYFESQVNLFETIGLLIALCFGKNACNEQEITDMMDIVMNPLFQNLKQCMDIFPTFQFPLDRQQVIMQTHHCLIALGTLARGFENFKFSESKNKNANIKNNEIIQKIIEVKFQNATEACLVILDYFKEFVYIRDSVRFTFSRFIAILDVNIKDSLTRLIQIILANEDISGTELINFISFINQIVYSFCKNWTFYSLLNELLESLFDRIFKVLNKQKLKIKEKESNTILQADPLLAKLKISSANLQKSYLTFIMTLVNNHVFSLMINAINQKTFVLVLNSIFEYVNDIEEPMVCKISFNLLENFVNLLSSGSLNDKNDIIFTQINTPLHLDGVEEYLLKTSILRCFEIPFQNSKLDIKDAQGRLIVNEISFLLKILFENYKVNMINYLTNVYFPEVGFPGDTAEEFLNNLVNSNEKQFKQYFVQFVARMKN